jgi:hypothetical protein
VKQLSPVNWGKKLPEWLKQPPTRVDGSLTMGGQQQQQQQQPDRTDLQAAAAAASACDCQRQRQLPFKKKTQKNAHQPHQRGAM